MCIWFFIVATLIAIMVTAYGIEVSPLSLGWTIGLSITLLIMWGIGYILTMGSAFINSGMINPEDVKKAMQNKGKR